MLIRNLIITSSALQERMHLSIVGLLTSACERVYLTRTLMRQDVLGISFPSLP